MLSTGRNLIEGKDLIERQKVKILKGLLFLIVRYKFFQILCKNVNYCYMDMLFLKESLADKDSECNAITSDHPKTAPECDDLTPADPLTSITVVLPFETSVLRPEHQSEMAQQEIRRFVEMIVLQRFHLCLNPFVVSTMWSQN